jgi:hypothetical protein
MATAQNAARVPTTFTRSRCVFFWWPWNSADLSPPGENPAVGMSRQVPL